MKIVTAILVSLVLLSAWSHSLGTAGGPPRLSHNPFSRPSSEVTRDIPSPIERDDGDGVTLDLQATMVGNMSKLANVAGRILKPGDEIEGYLLVAIYEEYAVFRRDSNTITVYVKPHLAEDDE
ncbi:MAG: hypothetical protein ACR2QI_05730 [Woeseiaceae bacterium]